MTLKQPSALKVTVLDQRGVETDSIQLTQNSSTVGTLTATDEVKYSADGMKQLLQAGFNDSIELLNDIFGSGFEIELRELYKERGLSSISTYAATIVLGEQKILLDKLSFNKKHLQELSTIDEAKDIVLKAICGAISGQRKIYGHFTRNMTDEDLKVIPMLMSSSQKESCKEKIITMGLLKDDFIQNLMEGNLEKMGLADDEKNVTSEERRDITKIFVYIGLAYKNFTDDEMNIFKEKIIKTLKKHYSNRKNAEEIKINDLSFSFDQLKNKKTHKVYEYARIKISSDLDSKSVSSSFSSDAKWDITK